jgi:primosomal protein N'
MRDLLQTTLLCVDVAVPLPIMGLFTYQVPEGLEEKAKVGVRVRVSFKNRDLIGYVVQRRVIGEGSIL